MKICSVCGEEKPVESFGWARGGAATNGIRRAMCRPCYNVKRKEHYHRPEVKAVKNKLSREYNERPEVKEKRRIYSSNPENRAKESEIRKKYKSQPEVQEAIRRKKAENHKRINFRAAMLMTSVVSRCRKGSLPLGITVQWIEAILEKGVCQVSGLPFDFGRHATTRRNPFGPSIDQIVAGKGYTLENSRVVLTAINLALCEWGVDTYVQIAQEVLRAQGFSVMKVGSVSEQSL